MFLLASSESVWLMLMRQTSQTMILFHPDNGIESKEKLFGNAALKSAIVDPA